MNAIWNIVEPYILTIVGALGGGSVIYVIARILLGRLIDKASKVYDLNALADKVADKLGGKTIDIDITSIVEKRLKEIADALTKEEGKVAEETNSYKHLLACMGEAIARLKMLTDDERNALIAAVRELDSEYVPPEKEVIATVKLEPIPVSTPSGESKQQTVNME